MNEMNNKHTMIFLVKEWLYQRRWMTCCFLSVVFYPLGAAVSVPTACYDWKNRFEQSRSGIRSGAAALAVASAELIAACLVGVFNHDGTAVAVLSAHALLCASWGIFSILLCKKINDRNAAFDYFDNIIEVHHITAVDKIAKIIGKNPQTTLNMLRDMIDRQRLTQAAISGDRKEVIVNRAWYRQSLICENCGAEYTINVGHDVVCPYCGDPSAERYLGGVSDNARQTGAHGPLASVVQKHTFAFSVVGILAALAAYVLVFPVVRSRATGFLLPALLLFLTGVLLRALSVVYGDEQKLESVFLFFRRHRRLNTCIQAVTGLSEVLLAISGFVFLFIAFEMDSYYETAVMLAYGMTVIVTFLYSVLIVMKTSVKEAGYWK